MLFEPGSGPWAQLQLAQSVHGTCCTMQLQQAAKHAGLLTARGIAQSQIATAMVGCSMLPYMPLS